ncbi:radical SAM protein [bacterium]|nr:MAG: radical SAM protein [bacterium]
MELVKKEMPGVFTLLGGHHASAIPEHTLKTEPVDFVLQGEGYQPIVELLRAVKKGSREFNITGIWYKDAKGNCVNNGSFLGSHKLDELPMVAWDMLPMEKYRAHHWQAWDYDLDTSRFAMIYTSLGCAFACDFCSVNVVYGNRQVRFRSVEHVVAELKMLVEQYQIRHVEVVDDTFTINAKRVEALCDCIIAAGLGDRLNMWCFGRTDTVEPGLMRKMKAAGFNWVFMGFESGNDQILQSINKKQNTDKIKRANDIVRGAGIRVGGNYIFCHQEDTPETMQDTLELAKLLNVEYANFFLTMPYPGTNLYRIAQEKGYPLPEKWGQYGFFAPDAMPLRNKHLTSWDIIQFRDKAFNEYYQSASYQEMVREVFGEKILAFLKEKVLSKEMVRRPPPQAML